jgi:hypothetical protein
LSTVDILFATVGILFTAIDTLFAIPAGEVRHPPLPPDATPAPHALAIRWSAPPGALLLLWIHRQGDFLLSVLLVLWRPDAIYAPPSAPLDPATNKSSAITASPHQLPKESKIIIDVQNTGNCCRGGCHSQERIVM